MKLYVKTDSIYGYISLVTKPVSEQTISALDDFIDSVGEIIPVQEPGHFQVNNITYSVYQMQELESKVPSWSTKRTYTTMGSGTTISKSVLTRTVSTIPAGFSDKEKLNLVEILTVLAKNSHTHRKEDDQQKLEQPTGTLTPSVYESCTYYNNRSGGNGKCAWWG